MFKNNKWLVLAVLAVAAFIMAACAPAEPETIIETVVVEEEGETIVETVVVTQEADEEMDDEEMAEEEAAGAASDVFVTGIFSDIATTNYWASLGPSNDVWTSYVLSGRVPSLYTLSDQRYDFVPFTAAAAPGERVEDGDTTTITVEMLPDLTWSDGEALTAEDVVFTVETVQNLGLGGNWPSLVPGSLDTVTADSDTTLTFTFSTTPGLAEFEYGVAQMPIMAEHFWGPIVEEAAAALEEVGEAPEAPGEDASEDEQAAFDEALAAFQEAQAEARNILYEADSTEEPVFGPFTSGTYEPGAFADKIAVDTYPFSGLTTTLYENGAYESELPNGETVVLYGEPTGDVQLELTTGPYVNEVVYSIYGSQDAAYLALQEGEIDYVFSPLGLSTGLLNQVSGAQGIEIATNDQNGFRYLAFNTRKAPMSDVAFRQAVATVIDQPFIMDTILGGAALPAFSVVPPGNQFWYNPDTPRWGFDEEGNSLSEEDRFNAAKQILIDAGYSWETEPIYNSETQAVERGTVLIQPDGTPVPEIEMLAPNSGYDPLRATSAIWVEEFSRNLGIPVTANLQPFQTIIPAAFAEGEAAQDWDWYILGWGLTIYPDYICDFFTSDQDSAGGGFNTPGYSNPEFDERCAEFKAETDLDAAQQLAYELQETLAIDAPYVVLFTNPIIDAYSTNVDFPYTNVLDGIQAFNGLLGTVQVSE